MRRPQYLREKAFALFFAAVLTITASATAQSFFNTPQSLLKAEGYLSQAAFLPGSTARAALTAEISAGWHINSHTPPDDYMIPTVLNVEAPEGLKVARLLYPEAEEKELGISDIPLPLYEGTVTFGAVIEISEDIAPGEYAITLILDYQGCDNMTCLQPESKSVELTVNVTKDAEAAAPANEAVFTSPPFDGAPEAAEVSAAPSQDDEFGGMVKDRGLFLSFIFIFLGGLALNLTPCIYPLIPITISFFGGQAEGRTSRAFALSLLYVLGISITYSILGVIAASTGSLLGGALQNPWVIAFIALVLVGLATSMFGLWEIRMPSFVMRKTGTAKRGWLGALLMGLTVGIVAAPCIGPFVFGLLTYVGNLGKPVLGFLMFFTLAWGMGIPFIVLGTVSGSISRLPRSGEWLDWVRRIFGFILILMAFYFARLILGPRITYAGYALTCAAAGIYLGWLVRMEGSGKRFGIIRKAVGVAFLAAAVILALQRGGPLLRTEKEEGVIWNPYARSALAGAAEEGKPAMIDFSADWCIPCHELDAKTFTDREVIELSKKFVNLKVDLTSSSDSNEKIKKEFKIRGVPTIIFFNSKGEEIESLRVTGFIEPGEFAERMKKAK